MGGNRTPARRDSPHRACVSIRLSCSTCADCTIRIRFVRRTGRATSAVPANPEPGGFRTGNENAMVKKHDYIWSDPFRRIPLRTSFSEFRQNGQRRFRSENEHEESIPSSLSRYVPIYRHHAAVFARYCAEGRLSPKQLHTIECLYIDGMTLRELAKLDGVAPQAISDRINAMATRAIEFYRWWRKSNSSHQRSRSPTPGRRRNGTPGTR